MSKMVPAILIWWFYSKTMLNVWIVTFLPCHEAKTEYLISIKKKQCWEHGAKIVNGKMLCISFLWRHNVKIVNFTQFFFFFYLKPMLQAIIITLLRKHDAKIGNFKGRALIVTILLKSDVKIVHFNVGTLIVTILLKSDVKIVNFNVGTLIVTILLKSDIKIVNFNVGALIVTILLKSDVKIVNFSVRSINCHNFTKTWW